MFSLEDGTFGRQIFKLTTLNRTYTLLFCYIIILFLHWTFFTLLYYPTNAQYTKYFRYIIFNR